MTRPKRKRGAPHPPRATGHRRPVAPDAATARGYPSAHAVLRSEACRSLLDRAVRVAAGTGILALGTQLAACAEPTCAATPMEELGYHGEIAVHSLVEFGDYRWAAEQLGVATGVVDHPAFHPGAIAGAMPMPEAFLETLVAPEDTDPDPLELPEADGAVVPQITDETE